MKSGILETIGYTELDAEQRIEAFLKQERSRLIDIRFMPRCRWNARWNKTALQRTYGKAYLHLRTLGNVNYNQPEKPIVLADPGKHLDALVYGLQNGYSLLLLCACKNYERCHRKTVYDLIQTALAKAEQEEKERLQVLACQPRMDLVGPDGVMKGLLLDGRMICTTGENFVEALHFMPSDFLNNPENWLTCVDGKEVWIEEPAQA